VTRVSEILPASGGEVKRRNIVLRRQNGDSVRVDLARFQQLGDLDANPALREGDVLVVPTPEQRIYLYGVTRFPGTYEFRPGDSLAGLLEIANGGSTFPARAADSIRVTRFLTPTRQQVFVISRAEAVGERGRAFMLQPSDGVHIPGRSNFEVQRVAEVRGQVMNPGLYPIVPGRTTVRELVAMAGGLTAHASLPNATLQRKTNQGQAAALARFRALPAELLTEEERRVLTASTESAEGTVVVDFQQLFGTGGAAFDQPLEADDMLNFPSQRQEISILGAVRRPGVVHYVPGMGVEQLLHLAGGPVARADLGGTTILKASTGARLSARDARTLDPGDTVVIPYEGRRDWGKILQTTSAVVATITGLIISANAVF
jgi:protein involved in polysaccharide export with SLBB domain